MKPSNLKKQLPQRTQGSAEENQKVKAFNLKPTDIYRKDAKVAKKSDSYEYKDANQSGGRL